jgi:hypothetical protein
MQRLSREQVIGLAPDAAAARAGQGQAARSKWTGLGQDEQAAWGECQGSGAVPYRCQVAADDYASRCSCPSRKLPCKHALGLLLLLSAAELPPATRPEWVAQWLESRAARTGHAAAAGPDGLPADPAAQLRRAAERDRKVDTGVAELRLWLADLARTGLAFAQGQPWEWWDQAARRMIDAQARGLAGQIRRMASIATSAGQSADWPDRMLDRLGALHLLCEAWTRRDQLSGPTADALRARIGYTQNAEEVRASGERVTDVWAVLGQRYAEDDNLRSLQQWLYGESSGLVVTYLAFAAGGQPLEPGLPPGQRTAATVVLYPGSRPARVLLADRQPASKPLGLLPGCDSWAAAMAQVADVLAIDPWADVIPLAVRNVTVLPHLAPAGVPPSGGRAASARWLLRDAAGQAVPASGPAEACWRLYAVSAGRPVDVAGEWDGFGFSPQAAAPAGAAGHLIT